MSQETGASQTEPHSRDAERSAVTVREARLLTDSPWVRSLGRLDMSVTTEGWKFPSPPVEYTTPSAACGGAKATLPYPAPVRQPVALPALPDGQEPARPRIRPKPTA